MRDLLRKLRSVKRFVMFFLFIWFAMIIKFGFGGKLINALGVERVAVKTGGEMNNYHFTN